MGYACAHGATALRTIAIVNQKGGSGKTTTAINLSASLASLGHPTLLVDLDPQSHCALGLAIPDGRIDLHVGDALLAPDDRQLDVSRLLWSVRSGLHLMPSTTKLAGLEAPRGGLASRTDRDSRLRTTLRKLADRYTWAVVDCSPSIGLLTFNALRAADVVLIPVETGYFALRGAEKQVAALEAMSRRMGEAPSYRVLATMHDPASALSRDVVNELHRRFGNAVVPTVVRQDGRLKEAASLGVPVIDYAPRSKGAEDYLELARWVERRLGDGESLAASTGASATTTLFGAPEESGHSGATTCPAPADDATGEMEDASAAQEHEIAPAMSRAAELAARANRLIAASEETHRSRMRDERVVQAMMEITAPTSAFVAHPARQVAHSEIARFFGAHHTARGVLFVQPGSADQVLAIAGDHNGWSTTASPMRFNAALGVFETVIEAKPGALRYRLVIDGRWMTDPYNPDSVTNAFGEKDSVVHVPAAHAQPTGGPQ
ncbi:MAG: AAA family ATPase [Phycisphaerales bacterium]|nr:AAA family ATPase [Phycisphaerales bacterium]